MRITKIGDFNPDRYIAPDEFHQVRSVADVTADLLGQTEELVISRYPTGAVDWDDIWDRIESSNPELDLGNESDTPAMQHLRRQALKARRRAR